MSEETRNNPARRRLLKVTALTAATTGLYGVAPFFGPWKQHHGRVDRKRSLRIPLACLLLVLRRDSSILR